MLPETSRSAELRQVDTLQLIRGPLGIKDLRSRLEVKTAVRVDSYVRRDASCGVGTQDLSKGLAWDLAGYLPGWSLCWLRGYQLSR